MRRVRLAIDLYAGSYFEVSREAKLLAMVSALEVTLESTSIFREGLLALDAAVAEVERIWASSELDDHPEFDRLMNRIRDLREESISQRLRDQIAQRGPGDPAELRQSLTDAYRTRSRLVHDGRVEEERLVRGLTFLQTFVPSYLAQEFRRVAG